MHKKSPQQIVSVKLIAWLAIALFSSVSLAKDGPKTPLRAAESKQSTNEASLGAGMRQGLSSEFLFEVKGEKAKDVVLKVYRLFADQKDRSTALRSPMPLNKMVSLRVDLINGSSKKLSLKSFDARMPAHDHGMMTKPVVTKVSSGQSVKDRSYKVVGVNLHMRGKWVLYFTLTPDGSTKETVLSYPLAIP